MCPCQGGGSGIQGDHGAGNERVELYGVLGQEVSSKVYYSKKFIYRE